MQYIKVAPNVPAPTRALAMLGVNALPNDQLDFILNIATEIEPLVKARDIDGIRAKLEELELPPDVMKMAEDLLTHHAKNENNDQG